MRESLFERGAVGGGMGGHSAPVRGEEETWLTPPHILHALGHFDLDPCACPSPRPWDTATAHFEKSDDGLSRQWSGRVWCNPPYGDVVGEWLQRLAAHGDGIALIFARTETAAWHDHVWPKADALLFLRGRLWFYRPDGTQAKSNAGAPSALIAFGRSNVEAMAASDIPGELIRLHLLRSA